MKERMVRVETKLEDTVSELKDINLKLDKFIDCADDKYASKWTEKIMYGLVGVILIFVISSLLKLI